MNYLIIFSLYTIYLFSFYFYLNRGLWNNCVNITYPKFIYHISLAIRLINLKKKIVYIFDFYLTKINNLNNLVVTFTSKCIIYF